MLIVSFVLFVKIQQFTSIHSNSHSIVLLLYVFHFLRKQKNMCELYMLIRKSVFFISKENVLNESTRGIATY